MADTKYTDRLARNDLDHLEGHLEEQLERVRKVRELLLAGDHAAAVNAFSIGVYLDTTQVTSARSRLDRALGRSLGLYELCDHETGEVIRQATREEAEAAERDGGTGVIVVNGRQCFVR